MLPDKARKDSSRLIIHKWRVIVYTQESRFSTVSLVLGRLKEMMEVVYLLPCGSSAVLILFSLWSYQCMVDWTSDDNLKNPFYRAILFLSMIKQQQSCTWMGHGKKSGKCWLFWSAHKTRSPSTLVSEWWEYGPKYKICYCQILQFSSAPLP